MKDLALLVNELIKLPNETQWVEFKHNNFNPNMIGEDLCALANAASIAGRECAYMIWGVSDLTHEVIGCREDLQNIKVGNEELENWLRKLLSDNADFEFCSAEVSDRNVAVMKVMPARHLPVTFKSCAFVRIGSYTKKLHEYPEVGRKLWKALDAWEFECESAMENLTPADVLSQLDVSAYFDRLGIPQPTDFNEVIKYLADDRVLLQQDDGRLSITNLGAVLFGRKLKNFSNLSHRILRIIRHKGKERLEMGRDRDFESGYGLIFEEAVSYIMALTPSEEPIEGAIRNRRTAYPEIAVREFLANALIHQDFSEKGQGPLVEIFDDRIEFTNGGRLLVDAKRIVDSPPRSRNEKLSALMRRMRLCEESGSGWDKAVRGCEEIGLPGPRIEVYESSTKVALFAKLGFDNLTMEDRIWACYLHACVMHLQHCRVTNASLRARFGEDDLTSARISRLLAKTMEAGQIKLFDVNARLKGASYVPYWA